MKYGIQMYSLRDLAKKDLFEAMKYVADLGYSYAEYAGFFDHSAEEIAAKQQELGLECSGTHSPWTDLTPDKIEATIRYHKIIGNHNYIVPGADLGDMAKIDNFISVMNYAQPILAKEGIHLGYHNHSHEFAKQEWGGTIYEQIENRTDIDLEIDTFWAFNAGIDPIAMMERLKNRVHIIHLKDGFRGGRGIPLGDGEAPVREVIKKAGELGMLPVVESETLTPDGPTEVRRCMEFLKSL